MELFNFVVNLTKLKLLEMIANVTDQHGKFSICFGPDFKFFRLQQSLSFVKLSPLFAFCKNNIG
jgi:hypothetical protein